MGAFSLFSDGQATMKEMFADLPTQARTFITRGFQAIPTLTPPQLEAAAVEAKESFSASTNINVESFAEHLGLEEDKAGVLISAISVLLALLSSRTESPEEITEGLIEADLLTESSRMSTVILLQLLAVDRDDIRKSMRIGKLATSILPSFSYFAASVDVRLDFSSTGVEAVVPVVVAHLRTDHDDTEVFFQLKKSDVTGLIEKLQAILRNIETAEAWSAARSL